MLSIVEVLMFLAIAAIVLAQVIVPALRDEPWTAVVPPAFAGDGSMFDAIRAHFESRGAQSVRTLVDSTDAGVAGFLKAIGFTPAPLQALEIRLPGR